MMRLLALLALGWLQAGAAHAHRSSDAYLTLAVDGARVEGHWEIALRDLPLLADVDRDGDRQLTWGELRQAEDELRSAVAGALRIDADGERCDLGLGPLQVSDRSDGRYAWFPLDGRCRAAAAVLAIDYRLLFDLDPDHRGVLILASGDTRHAAVLAPDRAGQSFRLAEASHLRLFSDYFREGVHHIWIGLDHILFLLALLLPSVLVRREGAWHPAPALDEVVWDTVRVVTAFTLAHSVTLTLAALGLVRLPGALVESVIAASVALAALNNLRPVVTGRRWLLAFGFGLLHGFGFASVLGELGLPEGARLLALLAFNLGVEAGQLAIVLAAVPILFVLRRKRFYVPIILQAGSLAAAVLAAFWIAQRLDLSAP